jgi:tight adherence protein B
MTSLGCAVLAVLLAVRRPAARSLHSRLAPPAAAAGTDVYGQGRTPSRRSWTILTILIMLLSLINAAGYLGGSRAAVLATAAVLIMATVTRLVAQYRRRRSARQARADVAHACTALASYLRVGQVPSAALPIAAADCDVLREGQQAHTHTRRERGSCMAPAGAACRAQRPS